VDEPESSREISGRAVVITLFGLAALATVIVWLTLG
jgi:hypothetical protein